MMLGLFGAAISSQTAYTQTDYEEYLIVETDTAQDLAQKNAGSGESINLNCGAYAINSNLVV